MTEKQYPELPEPTAWRTYDNLLKRARYDAMPITSMQPGIYSHTRMFTEDQMYAYVDADRAMRAEQAAHAAVAAPDDRCQHCVNRSDGFYGSFAPECPSHNDDGTARTQAAQRRLNATPVRAVAVEGTVMQHET